MICLLKSYNTWPSRVRRNFFLLRSVRSDLNWRSSELICWLTADCVTLLICAALVKLSVSARSQNTLRLSICTKQLNRKENSASTGRWDAAEHELHFHQQFLRGEGLL